MMQNATEELKRLEEAFNAVRQGIFTRLHDVVRDQIFVAGGEKVGLAQSSLQVSLAETIPSTSNSKPRNPADSNGSSTDLSKLPHEVTHRKSAP